MRRWGTSVLSTHFKSISPFLPIPILSFRKGWIQFEWGECTGLGKLGPRYRVGGGCRQLQFRANGHHQTFDSRKFLGRVQRNYHCVFHKIYVLQIKFYTSSYSLTCVCVTHTRRDFTAHPQQVDYLDAYLQIT